MKLELYTNYSDTKRIGKNLVLVDTLDGILLKEDTDLVHPVFTFHKFKSEDNSWIFKNFNYCKLIWSGWEYEIENDNYQIKRCYFVGKLRLTKGGIVEIPCEEDVRETWKDYILAQNYLVKRQEYVHNKCVADDRKVLPVTRTVEAKKLGTVGDGGDGTIVLTVTGGV